MADKRIQRAYQQVSEDGSLKVNIYGPAGADGKQPVAKVVTYDTTKLPKKMLAYCAAKGLGFYMAGRYAGDEVENAADVEEACNTLYAEMELGRFIPGRAGGDARPTPFLEALTEFLGKSHPGITLEQVIAQIAADKVRFSPGNLGKMAKFPAVAAITARIERERAADKERKAKAAIKDAPEMDLAGLFDAPPAEAAEAA